MCAPGSKEWRSCRALLFGLLALSTYAVAGLAVWHFLLAFGVQYELHWQDRTPGNTKVYASQEVVDELEGLQRYVAALAAHDIHGSTHVFASAAFDLVARDPVDVAQGVIDWHAFLSPAQQHAHTMVAQLPLTWGGLSDLANDYLWKVAALPHASVAHPTI